MLAPLLVFQYFRLKLCPSLAGIGQVILRKRYTFLVVRVIWQGYRVVGTYLPFEKKSI